jgi:hypothetical protein
VVLSQSSTWYVSLLQSTNCPICVAANRSPQIPLFLMAGRNNPLIGLLGISFDTFNLLHRWFGRIVAAEAVTHVLAFLVANAATAGWASAIHTAVTVPYMMYGFIVSGKPFPCPFFPSVV